VVKFSAACAYGEAGTVSDGRKGKELECRYHVDVDVQYLGISRCSTGRGNSHGVHESRAGWSLEGLGRRRIDRSAGACMRSSSSARIRSGCGNRFCVEKGTIEFHGFGALFSTAERFCMRTRRLRLRLWKYEAV
jgi:hypothetical protein